MNLAIDDLRKGGETNLLTERELKTERGGVAVLIAYALGEAAKGMVEYVTAKAHVGCFIENVSGSNSVTTTSQHVSRE